MKLKEDIDNKLILFDVKTEGFYRSVGDRFLVKIEDQILGIGEIMKVELEGNIKYPKYKKTLYID